MLSFFYDAEITEELVFRGYELIQLDLSKPIPVQAKFVYWRYEKTLPRIERESHAFLLKEKERPEHAIFRLDMQQALVSRVTPELRHVSVSAEPETKKLIAHFIYDGEISDLNRHLAFDAS